MPAKLVEGCTLHRENAPIGIFRRMGLRQHVERLLEVAIVGQRPAVGREQALVAGMGDGGLFEHGGSLRALAVGAQRLAIGQRRVGILRVGAIAIAIGLHRALRIGID